jgi:DNA-directed RNA polymerase subunit RPC12/RpoP
MEIVEYNCPSCKSRFHFNDGKPHKVCACCNFNLVGTFVYVPEKCGKPIALDAKVKNEN